MAQLFNGRFTAKIEGDFVVFLIGMRINRLLLPHKWMPVARAMPPMIAELERRPELGLLHAEFFLGGRTILSLQYWRTFDQLHAYAHAKDLKHLPAWADFNRKIGNNGAVGVFHETYLVSAGRYESIFVNMPRMGLAAAAEMIPAIGRMQSAKSRLGAEDATS